jgi:hypothetical protein
MTIAPLQPGCRIRRSGSLQAGRAGAWFYSDRWGEPLLLTAAHLLGPAAVGGDRVSPVLRLDPPVVLCDGEGIYPAAAAVECGRHEPRFGITSADALLAVSLAPELIPAASYVPEAPFFLHDAQPGDRLLVAVEEETRTGRVVEAGWDSGHYGYEDDLLIEGLDPRPGDSGAILCEESTGMPAALLVGQALAVELNHRSYPRVVCAHRLRTVLTLFGGFEWLLSRPARG